MYEGVPTRTSVPVTAVTSAARAMPKSITFGPSEASSTLPGFRSRWMIPAAWIVWRASATPPTSSSTVSTGSGPWPRTTSERDRPGTYAVASHGAAPSVLLSRTGTV